MYRCGRFFRHGLSVGTGLAGGFLAFFLSAGLLGGGACFFLDYAVKLAVEFLGLLF